MLASNDKMERVDQRKWGLGKSIFEFEKGGYIYERCTTTDTLFVNPISIDKIMRLVGFTDIEITTPGELDIDIVKNVYDNGNVELPMFLSSLFNYSSDDVLNNFQLFIQNNNLSSHMRVIAQKP